jgi:hypothetical protein
MSSQACFLPVPKGSDATFNVSIFNYQSYSGHPAVLAIVATRYVSSARGVHVCRVSRVACRKEETHLAVQSGHVGAGGAGR